MSRTPKTPSSKKVRTPAKAVRHTKSVRAAAARTKEPRTKAAAPSTPTAHTGTKQAQLIALLRSPAGGTIGQMVDLTGWQPHSVRGVISGALRKKLGLSVTSTVEGDNRGRVYRIVETS